MVLVIGMLSGIDIFIVARSILIGLFIYVIVMASSYVFGIYPGSRFFLRKYKAGLKVMCQLICAAFILALLASWVILLIELSYPKSILVKDVSLENFWTLTIGIIAGIIHVIVMNVNYRNLRPERYYFNKKYN
ncbi:hypothetical protein HOE31_04275 [bacterium]|nr:hypothetical protein [bacterium]